MSRRHAGVPKGRACGLHLTDEYFQGQTAGQVGDEYTNPYDFFDEYEKHYAWDIGYQNGRKLDSHC